MFAFPKKRKEPLTDARHVRNALARFDQVEGVCTDEERGQAFANIKKAAKHYERRDNCEDLRGAESCHMRRGQRVKPMAQRCRCLGAARTSGLV